MGKERRVDPQVTLGLLTDGGGFPLAVHLFGGNKAETRTLIPVLTEFGADHPHAAGIVVVADAGLLSAANLLALEAGFGSSSAPGLGGVGQPGAARSTLGYARLPGSADQGDQWIGNATSQTSLSGAAATKSPKYTSRGAPPAVRPCSPIQCVTWS